MAFPLLDPETKSPWLRLPSGAARRQYALPGEQNVYAFDAFNPEDAKFRNDFTQGGPAGYNIRTISGSTTTEDDLKHWGLMPGTPSASFLAAMAGTNEADALARTQARRQREASIVENLASRGYFNPVADLPTVPVTEQNLGVSWSNPDPMSIMAALVGPGVRVGYAAR